MKRITLTNILLAIIAFCLVFNLLVNGNLISQAHAQGEKAKDPMEVIIVGVNTTSRLLPVSVESLNGAGLKNKPIAVNLLQVESKDIEKATPIKVVQGR